jgi:thiamine monophosphate kinase
VEKALASRWFVWVGGVAIALGGLLFVKYAHDMGLIPPVLRLIIGMAAAVGLDPIACILHGGEDYALVAASPAALPGFARVGEVTASGGLRVRGPRGEVAVAPRGFDHFGG